MYLKVTLKINYGNENFNTNHYNEIVIFYSLLSNLEYWQRDNRLTFDVLWFAITKTHAAHSDFRKITSISMNTLLRQLNHYDPFIKHEVRYLLSYDGLSRNLVIGLCVSTSFPPLFIHFDELNPPLLFVSFQGRG